jgi:Tfp pilus assembly protein FimV
MTATFHPSRDFVRASAPMRTPVGSARRSSTTSRPPAEANYLVRRVVAVVVAVCVLAAAAVALGEIAGAVSDLGGRPAAASEVTTDPAAPTSYVAAPGDTLWSIAERFRGDVGHARYLDALVSLNGGAGVQAGQAVRLP